MTQVAEKHRGSRIGWLRAALSAHARDELGFSKEQSAQPIRAALASAASFAVGAALPLAVASLVPGKGLMIWVALTSLIFLAVLGATAAQVGGASIWIGALRITFWGALAMAITAVVGGLFGVRA